MYNDAHVQVAPIIHEWTYDAMCHDLVDLDGNKYTMEVSFLWKLFYESSYYKMSLCDAWIIL